MIVVSFHEICSFVIRVGRIGKVGGGVPFLLGFFFFLPSIYFVIKLGCYMIIWGYVEVGCKNIFRLIYFKLQQEEE